MPDSRQDQRSDSPALSGPERGGVGALASERSQSARVMRDLMAGLTVAVVELPQAMAYALIAGVPPVYGIYTSVIQGLIGALLSANRHVRTGPTNTQALLVAAALSQLGQLEGSEYVGLVAALALLKGAIQLLAWVCGAGGLFRYVSPSTVVGVSAGAGVLIAAGQLPALLGLTGLARSEWPGLTGIVLSMAGAVTGGHMPDVRAAGVGVATIVLMLTLPRLHRFFPAALVCVGLAAATTWGLGWAAGAAPLATVGEIPRALPAILWPLADVGGDRLASLLVGALALAVLGMIEAVAIGRSLADDQAPRRDGSRDASRELLSQGTANVAASLFGAIPGSASFSRSMLDRAAGGATRLSGVAGSVAVAGMALLFAPVGTFVPLAALAGVLMVIGLKLIDVRYFARALRQYPSDFVVGLVSLLATVLLPLQFAVFVGVGLNLAIQLRVASRLRAVELLPTADGGFRESGPVQSGSGDLTAVRVVQLDGDLYFGLRDDLDAVLAQLEASAARAVVLRLRNTHTVDGSIHDTLAAFADRMRRGGRHVLLCGVRPALVTRLEGDRRLAPGPGGRVVYPGTDELLRSLREAVSEARRRAGEPEPPGGGTASEFVYVI